MTTTTAPEHLAPPPLTDGSNGRPQVGVVTVFSAKGGVGTTVVATNLAMSARLKGARVCLLDLALAFGDVAVCLQLAPRRTLMDALEIGISPSTVGELVTAHASGLDCVLSPVDPSGVERMPVEVVRALIVALRARYDVVVIDTPSDFGEHVLEAIDASDLLVFVTTPEIPAIKNSRIALDMLDLLGHPRERRRVMLNRADPALGLARSDVEDALQCDLSAELPDDRAVPLSINTGVPIVAARPTHPVARALSDFTVLEMFGTDPLVPAPAGRLRRRRRSA